jgi:hypothetical protein
VVLTHMHMDHIGGLLGLRGRLRRDLRIHVAAAEAEFWAGKADLSRASMPPGVPESLRSVAKRFLDEYHSRLQPFEQEHEVAPGVLVSRTGGHTPGHSVVRLESGGDRLMFGGDSVFPPGSTAPTGTTASTKSPRRQSASGSVSCGSSRRPASRWCPPTCRSRPPAEGRLHAELDRSATERPAAVGRLPGVKRRMQWFIDNRPDFRGCFRSSTTSCATVSGCRSRRRPGP